MDSKIKLNSIIGFLIFLVSFGSLPAVTVGVVKVKTRGGTPAAEILTNFLQSEIQKNGSVTVRDWKAIPDLIQHLERCQSGLVNCDVSGLNRQALDIIVFGEVQKKDDRFLVSVRAVSEKNWTVIYSGSAQDSSHEDALADLATEMNDSFKAVVSGARKLDQDADASGKYRIAVHKIRTANEAAQGVDVSGALDSILISAFGKNKRFEIVERSYINDLIQEKELAMSGLVETDKAAFEARGITHYLTGSLKVYDDVRVLSYQIINNNTGLPIVTDIVEWTDADELQDAMQDLAEQAETQVFDVNGKLVIKGCNAQNAHVLYENKAQSSFPVEMGLCPLKVEDMPAGQYSLIFKHEDFDTLTMPVAIKSQETTTLDFVKLPPISLDGFYDAQNKEYAGNYDQAIQGYQAFYNQYPRHRMAAYAMYREGFILQIYRKKYAEGHKLLERVIQQKPGADIRTEAYYGIALGYRASGDTAKGNQILKMLINEYPASTAAEAARGCLDSGNCGI
ncbi:MAG: tetratricopeptide repeat protein [Leptospiraceae bacterium]|nr:tetratricopeptide repeat protein [Leptospiraceae bacterium]